MWNAVILAVMIAAAGLYTTRNSQAIDSTFANVAGARAAETGIYRNAVVNYFSEHQALLSVAVSTADLKGGGYLPSWSSLYQQGTPLAWSNYRDGDGVIYIYANSLPDRNLVGELANLAQNSVLFGVYDAGKTTLQSPVSGDTGIPITALSGMSVPNGAPVWIATIK